MSQTCEPLEVKGCRRWRLPAIADGRGRLTIAELAELPFPVQRIFFISHVPAEAIRGNDAQRTGRELLVAISGSMSVSLDDGARRQEVPLRERESGLLIGPKVWHVVSRFSPSAVLAVLASHPYDEADHIRDYAEFLAIASTR
jgi:UDP-2-acetamido-3-amino-2,3-dideoxy-glucuronate N-acetyltransferase